MERDGEREVRRWGTDSRGERCDRCDRVGKRWWGRENGKGILRAKERTIEQSRTIYSFFSKLLME